MTVKVGVIGAGNMGAALVKGWLRAGVTGLVVWDKYEPAVRNLLAWQLDRTDSAAAAPDAAATTGAAGAAPAPALTAATSFEQLADCADILLVVVKPKDAPDLLRSLRGRLRPDQVVVSAMAGLALEWLRTTLGPGPELFRVMPNLAVELGAGAVAVAVEAQAAPVALEQVLALLRLLGLVEVLPEELFDVVTAVSGSSPAFLALAVEALEDGAVLAGLSRGDARRVVRAAALETARSLTEQSASPEAIREQLVSAGHLAPETVELLEERKLRVAFREAVGAAMERSRQMRKA